MKKHILDPADIDEYDEINGDEQCVSVWCKKCKKYEFRSLPICLIGTEGELIEFKGELVPYVGYLK